MIETVETYDGWYSLHDFRQLIGKNGKRLLKRLEKKNYKNFDQCKKTEDNKQRSHQLFSIVEQKADIMFMFLRSAMSK